MLNFLDQFDYSLLDDPEFREDSVREELVFPLLKELGYTASPPNKIIRSRRLEHPFVYFGTVKKDIVIIPDYLLERDNSPAWILDAKGPTEDIRHGKNPEQAYSYAVHRDIRVPYYALCNGRELVVFHIHQDEPVIDFPLNELKENWPLILTVLGCKSVWPEGRRPDFLPDLGLALQKAGLARDKDGEKTFHMFVGQPIMMATKVNDDLYTLSSPVGTALFDDGSSIFLASFDFKSDLYQAFLAQLNPQLTTIVQRELSNQPYRAMFLPETTPHLTFAAELGDTTFKNDNESYCPFVISEFI